MKRYKLRSWVKWVIAIIIFINIMMIFRLIDRNFIEQCTSAGYSETYCIAHK